MRRLWFTPLVLAAGCQPDPEVLPKVTANQIERAAGLKEEAPEPVITALPDGLLARDIAGQPRASCIFTRAPFVLFYATRQVGLIRIQGRLRHLPIAGSLAASGGFYDDGAFAVSIGRANESATWRAPGRWPGRMSVRNRRTGIRLEQQGEWVCGPLTAVG